MQYLITLCIYGAFCITVGYIVGSARAYYIHRATSKLLRDVIKTQVQIEQFKQDIERQLAEEADMEEYGK